MVKTIVPRPIFLPAHSVKLGRFVTNINQPHENYHEPPAAATPKPIVTPFSYSGYNQDSTGIRFGSALTHFLSTWFSKRAESMVRITPTSGMSYALDNSTSWFDQAVGIEETKRWIEKATLRGDDIYMIVGITTLTDASIVVASAQGQDVGGQINIPATLSLAAAGIIVPLAGLIDPKADGSYQSFDHLQARYLASGEQVCALQYRKVNHKWFSSRLIETSSLSKTRQWSCLEGDRRIAYEDEEDEGEELEDMIEVGLEDVGELDGEWRSEEVCGGGVICIQEG